MLSENLNKLRRQKGLSQEQLAESIGVSRQAISKWEIGQSTPELDKLIALSKFFDVSLDELTGNVSEKEEIESEKETVVTKETKSAKNALIAGVILSVLGVVLLIIAGVIILTSPSTADKIGASSVVTIDGTGIFFILSLIPLFVGVALILKKK